MDPIVATELAGNAAHSLSAWSLFMQAGWIVKLVMLMLLGASVWCWAIIVEKSMSLKKLRLAADQFEKTFWSGGSLETLFQRVEKRARDPMAATFVAGMREWQQSVAGGPAAPGPIGASVQQRIERQMSVTIGREMAKAEAYMTVLASVGSVAPFVGLFGTVWGIMTSFSAIANAKNTSLAVVAPGIAEALFATALGLIAAIPAVLAYNKFAADLARYGDRLEAFASEFGTILSRHLEDGA